MQKEIKLFEKKNVQQDEKLNHKCSLTTSLLFYVIKKQNCFTFDNISASIIFIFRHLKSEQAEMHNRAAIGIS